MKRILFFLLFAVSSSFLQAQINIQVGTGTGSSSNVPLTTNFGYNYTQSIYLASDITAAGGVPTYIHKIRYYTTSNPPANSDNWTIYMSNSSKTNFSSNTNWEIAANLTQVFNGTVTFPAANNWMEITLSTPFLWDGTSNILVAIDENGGNWGTLSSWRTTSSSPDSRSIYYRNDNTNPDPMSPPTATGRLTSTPNIQFEMYNGACAGTPVHDVVQVNNPSVCIGVPITLTADANNLNIGINYVWQYNSGSGWTNFTSSSNSWTFTTNELTQTSNVRAVVTCTNSNLTDTTGSVLVTINSLPNVQISASSVAYCNGSSVPLTASGATTYSWSPATFLDNANQANVNSTPSGAITYTVVGTDGNGCSNTTSVFLTEVGDLVPTVAVNPQQICSPGSPVSLSLSGLPMPSTGNYEYQFVAGDTATIVQPWGISATYTFTPNTDSIYSFYYQVRNSACPSQVTDSVRKTITVGFGADVNLVHFNCQHEGSIMLSNIFGQQSTDTLYVNPLNSPMNGDSIIFTGSASFADGRAVLTPSATGISGYMQIDTDPTALGLNNSMNVSFLLTADLPINNFGTGGADGITYSFGDDALPSANGGAPNGKGTKLRLCFDSANNGSENNNATGIYLVYGWNANNAYGPGNTEVLAYSSNTSLWKTLTDVPVSFTINPNGKANLMVNGVMVFENVQMPAAYMNADVSSWNHLFSAGTGGDALRQAVSGLSITSNSLNYGINSVDAINPPSQWQNEPEFENLQPGVYTVWISNPSDLNCNNNIGTYEIFNINPLVTWPNDTVVCNGDSITLDAGNINDSYIWSTNDTTQTITVAQSGSYAVFITDSVGCTGVGSIQVVLPPVPAAGGIYASGAFPTVFYSVLNPVNSATYNWDFGDGNTLINASSTVGHVYASMAVYNVSVTLSNEFGCDSTTISRLVNVNGNELTIEDQDLNNVNIYPNPASDFVNIMLDDYTNAHLTIYSISGAEVYNNVLTQSYLNVANLTNGVYMLKITIDDKSFVHRIMVNH